MRLALATCAHSRPLRETNADGSFLPSSPIHSISGGGIAGIVIAVIALAGIAAFILIFRKKSRSRRKAATEAYAAYMPDHDRASAYEIGNDEIMGGAAGVGAAGGGMVQREGSWRAVGGPRPPTMIESGRAGMGAGGAGVQRAM